MRRISKFFKTLAAVSVCATLVSVVSCKSPPVEESNIHPLSLLDKDSSIYVSVPAKNYVDLTSKILSSKAEGISEQDAKKIVERIDVLYAGLSTPKDRARLQISAKGSFPGIAQKAVLTKKNGFEKQKYEFKDTKYPSIDYYSMDGNSFQLSFPQESLICAAQNLYPVLEKFTREVQLSGFTPFNWIGQDNDEILVYITKPGQYLQNLIGSSINVNSRAIYGNLRQMIGQPKDSGKYELDFAIELSESKSMNFIMNSITLSLRMMGASAYQTNQNTIMVKGIPVSEKQIMDLFNRQNYKSKHFVIKDE